MAQAPSSPRRRMPRAEREQQLLDTAHALFAERGFAAATMDEVATRVGVTKPLLYAYWGNKERLYLACLERDAEALTDAVAAAVAAAPSPADALALAVRGFFAFVDADRSAFRVLFDETLPAGGPIAERIAVHRGRITELVATTLLAQMPERRRAAARLEVEALSHALLGAAEALCRWWLRDPDALPAAQAAELLVETVVPGLRARSHPFPTPEPPAEPPTSP